MTNAEYEALIHRWEQQAMKAAGVNREYMETYSQALLNSNRKTDKQREAEAVSKSGYIKLQAETEKIKADALLLVIKRILCIKEPESKVAI
ncbi:MAG: hypothetical protein KA383_12350 [Phycisphaerae bacterium]|nr:hypothetical protein [Phycisphaerae bacterium]